MHSEVEKLHEQWEALQQEWLDTELVSAHRSAAPTNTQHHQGVDSVFGAATVFGAAIASLRSDTIRARCAGVVHAHLGGHNDSTLARAKGIVSLSAHRQ